MARLGTARRARLAVAGAWLLALAACLPTAQELEPLPAVETTSLGTALARELDPLIARLQAEPRDASAAGKAGMLLQAYEQHGLAAGFLARARALAPESLQWEYYLGISLARLGRQEEAAASFRRCVEMDGGFLPSRRRLADALLDGGNVPASLEAYRSLARLAPEDARAHYGLGRAEVAAGRPDQASRHFLRATEIAPEYGAAHYALAQAYREAGSVAEANRHLKLYERHEHGAPADSDPLARAVAALRVTAAELLRQGVEARNAGRAEDAIRLHLQALEEDPTLAQARTNLVILYGSRGRGEQAEAQYRAALVSGATSAELHYNYGVLAYREGRPQDARQAFLEALGLNPNHALANHNLGQILEEEGRFDEAMAHYQRALENRPDHALSHYKVGMLWARRRQAREAVRSFREAAKDRSDRAPTYLFSLGGALLASGDREAARGAFADARRLAERHSQAELVGRIEQALRALDRR